MYGRPSDESERRTVFAAAEFADEGRIPTLIAESTTAGRLWFWHADRGDQPLWYVPRNSFHLRNCQPRRRAPIPARERPAQPSYRRSGNLTVFDGLATETRNEVLSPNVNCNNP